jgi:hypothetical protein
MLLLSFSLLDVAMAGEDLEVALGGLNRHLISIVLIAFFAVSVVTYWLGKLAIPIPFRRRAPLNARLPPPPSPVQGAKQQSEGFNPDRQILGEHSLTDESTCIDIAVLPFSQPIPDGSEELDVLDLELGRYVPGFRDEYFMVEVKDMWMRRFRAASPLDLDERFLPGLPMLEVADSSEVEELSVALIDSLVGFERCELRVGVCARVRGGGGEYRREIQETWTFVCEPQVDPSFKVESITGVS